MVLKACDRAQPAEQKSETAPVTDNGDAPAAKKVRIFYLLAPYQKIQYMM
jgi:hypothetical protein